MRDEVELDIWVGTGDREQRTLSNALEFSEGVHRGIESPP